MNIARLLPQKMLNKTIEKRRLNRIQEYTSVADSLEPKFAQKINENIEVILLQCFQLLLYEELSFGIRTGRRFVPKFNAVKCL